MLNSNDKHEPLPASEIDVATDIGTLPPNRRPDLVMLAIVVGVLAVIALGAYIG